MNKYYRYELIQKYYNGEPAQPEEFKLDINNEQMVYSASSSSCANGDYVVFDGEIKLYYLYICPNESYPIYDKTKTQTFSKKYISLPSSFDKLFVVNTQDIVIDNLTVNINNNLDLRYSFCNNYSFCTNITSTGFDIPCNNEICINNNKIEKITLRQQSTNTIPLASLACTFANNPVNIIDITNLRTPHSGVPSSNLNTFGGCNATVLCKSYQKEYFERYSEYFSIDLKYLSFEVI